MHLVNQEGMKALGQWDWHKSMLGKITELPSLFTPNVLHHLVKLMCNVDCTLSVS